MKGIETTDRPAEHDDRVRTTVSLPEDVWLRAKAACSKRRCTMSELGTEAFMAVLPKLETETNAGTGGVE